jgi:cytoskeleton protein RodZ
MSTGCNYTSDIGANGVGATLKKMREMREFTHEEVAHRLRLQVSVIEFVESEAFPGNLPEIFAKGYLKSYARLLQFSEEDIQAMLAALEFKSVLLNWSAMPAKRSHDMHHPLIYFIVIMLILIMIALFIFWWEPTVYQAIYQTLYQIIYQYLH